MKKELIIIALGLSLATNVFAAPQKQKGPQSQQQACQYTFLQNLIRDSRTHERIFELIKSGVSMDDSTIICGGTPLQLAIRRGNPSIVNAILVQNKKRANDLVSTAGFNIPGAPEKIPAILFAAYYSPSETVFQTFLKNEGDVSLKDQKGRDILWYLDRNPVLRQTATEDAVNLALQNNLLRNAQEQVAAEKQAKIAAQKEKKTVKEEAVSLDSDTFVTPQESNQ